MPEVRKEAIPKFSRMFALKKADSVSAIGKWTGYPVMYAHVQLGSIPREKFNETNDENSRHIGRKVSIKFILRDQLIAETNYVITHVELAHTSKVARAVIEAANNDFETLEFRG
jgi:hypothetical protein